MPQNIPQTGEPEQPRDFLAWLLGVLFLLVFIVVPMLMASRSTPQTSVLVPRHNLAAYERITTSDLTTTQLLRAQLPTGVITSTATLSEAIALVPLPAGKPITTGQVFAIADTDLISNTVIVAVEGGNTLTFGNTLRPGMVVSAWDGEQKIVDRLLVVDVKPSSSTDDPRNVVIVAVPRELRDEMMAAATEEVLSFSLTP